MEFVGLRCGYAFSLATAVTALPPKGPCRYYITNGIQYVACLLVVVVTCWRIRPKRLMKCSVTSFHDNYEHI
jgi:hypothetical protein